MNYKYSLVFMLFLLLSVGITLYLYGEYVKKNSFQPCCVRPDAIARDLRISDDELRIKSGRNREFVETIFVGDCYYNLYDSWTLDGNYNRRYTSETVLDHCLNETSNDSPNISTKVEQK